MSQFYFQPRQAAGFSRMKNEFCEFHPMTIIRVHQIRAWPPHLIRVGVNDSIAWLMINMQTERKQP